MESARSILPPDTRPTFRPPESQECTPTSTRDSTVVFLHRLAVVSGRPHVPRYPHSTHHLKRRRRLAHAPSSRVSATATPALLDGGHGATHTSAQQALCCRRTVSKITSLHVMLSAGSTTSARFFMGNGVVLPRYSNAPDQSYFLRSTSSPQRMLASPSSRQPQSFMHEVYVLYSFVLHSDEQSLPSLPQSLC